MPMRSFGLGFAGTTADRIQQERDRTRQAEDAQLQQQMDLIHGITSRSDFNPAELGTALHDLVNLGAAKGGRGKAKGGVEGFYGAHELPLSQLLSGIQSGTRPIVGPTTQQVTNSAGAFPMTGAGKISPLSLPGQVDPTTSLPNAPLPMLPAGRMQSPTQTMQPLPREQQPYFRSPEEMAQQQGMTAGIQEGAKRTADMQSRQQMAQQLGLDPEEFSRFILTGQIPPPKMGASKIFHVPDGAGGVRAVMATPQMVDGQIRWIGHDGQPLPANATAAETGRGAQGKTLKDEHGNFWQQNPDGTWAKSHDAAGNPIVGAVSGGGGHLVQGTVDGQPASVIIHNDGSITKVQPYEGLFAGGGTSTPTSGATPSGNIPQPPAPGGTPSPVGATDMSGPDQFFPGQAQGSPTPPATAVPGDTWYMSDGRTAVLSDSGQWIAPTRPGGLIPSPGAKPAQGTAQATQMQTGQKTGSFVPGKEAKPNQTEMNAIHNLDKAVPLIKDLEATMSKKWGPDQSKYPGTLGEKLHGIGQMGRYDAGFPQTDEVYSGFTSLGSLLSPLQSSEYLHGVRNYRYIKDIQRHMIKTGLLNVDTPALAIDKLFWIKRNMNSFMKEYGKPAPFPEVGYADDQGEIPTPPTFKK